MHLVIHELKYSGSIFDSFHRISLLPFIRASLYCPFHPFCGSIAYLCNRVLYQVGRQGWRGGVRTGYVVAELNGELLASGLSNDTFRVQIASLPRPVVLGFRRPSSLPPPRGSNLDRSVGRSVRGNDFGAADAARGGREVNNSASRTALTPPPSAPLRESGESGSEVEPSSGADVDRTPQPPTPAYSSSLLPLDTADHERNMNFLRVSEPATNDEEPGNDILEAFVVDSSRPSSPSASSVSSSSSSSSSSWRTSDPDGTDRLRRLQQRLRTRSQSDEQLFTQAGAAFGQSPGISTELTNQAELEANSATSPRNEEPSRLFEAML